MTQPKFTPILEQDEVRAGFHLGVPAAWEPHRPGESRPTPLLRDPAGLGFPGPDQGYALALAERFADRLALEAGEHTQDVLAGAVAIALRRAAIFGRAPVSADVEHALRLFKFIVGDQETWPPADLLTWRGEHFAGAAHDYWRRRSLADAVPGTTLRLSAKTVAERIESEPGSWKDLAGA